ncbi:MAG: GNAT family N-acetyltransferase [Acidimicrobiia bacterium]
MARSRTDQTVVWGIASGLLFLVAATLFAAALTVDDDASWICAGLASLLGLLAVVSFSLALAVHFELWPYPPEPDRQTTPRSGSVQLTRRPADASDTEFARDAHHRAYRDVVERQFGSWNREEQDGFFDRNWAGGGVEVLLCDDTPCGYVAVEQRTDDLYVRELVILPEFQNRGIGSAVLAETLDLANSRDAPVHLQVLRENRARLLYERLGFTETGRTSTHVLLERGTRRPEPTVTPP